VIEHVTSASFRA
jgi:hypothetical protein